MVWSLAPKKAQTMILRLLLLFLSLSIYSNESIFEKIDDTSNVFQAGLILSGLESGVHYLESKNEKQTELVIAIHGGGSLGYEWVYPLQQLNSPSNLVGYYRWQPLALNCLSDDIDNLKKFLEQNVESYESILILGHSLGGILLGKVLEILETNVEVDAHIIASPLAGISPTNTLCNYEPPKMTKNNIKLYEWRTIKKLDGVYLALPYDPQIVDIKGSTVTRLPEEYNGNKLGHNWAISWVADEIVRR